MTPQPLAGRTLGFVGVGLMGAPMCRNLLAAGADLVAYNRTREKAEGLSAGAPGRVRVAASPAELAMAIGDAIIVNLVDTMAVDRALRGPDPAGLLEGLRPGTMVIDMGTSGVAETRGFAAEVEARGGAYVDAPVSGGVVGAEAASLTVFMGGRDDAAARARPVLEVLGRNITHCGPVGCGQVTKIANQMIVALTIGAVAEAMALAEKAGVAPAVLQQALKGGFADSRILEVHGARMVAESFAPGGRARIQRKDVQLALDLGQAVGMELPSSARSIELWDRMIARGWGDLDHSGLIKIYRE
ncbi:MAG: 2-hydroxy-3-oxopropionate reductase [Alphaproteobacteria bacterium]|nr:MAG: 2-hydroxy-3-oxopropionate reductase [Alphaproteobacteria bacterium]